MCGAVLHISSRNHEVVLNRAHGQILNYLIYKVLAFVVTCDTYLPSHNPVDMVRSNYTI